MHFCKMHKATQKSKSLKYMWIAILLFNMNENHKQTLFIFIDSFHLNRDVPKSVWTELLQVLHILCVNKEYVVNISKKLFFLSLKHTV